MKTSDTFIIYCSDLFPFKCDQNDIFSTCLHYRNLENTNSLPCSIYI